MPDRTLSAAGDLLGAGYAARQLRRCNRNLLLVNVGLLLAIVLFAASNVRYLYNFVSGPFPVDEALLLSVAAAPATTKDFVAFAPERIWSTGVHDIKQGRDADGGVTRESILADYQVALVAGKLMLVKTEPGLLPHPLQGAVVPVEAEALAAVRAALARSHPELGNDDYLAAMLDATDFRTSGYVAFLIGAPLALVALWNIGKAVGRSRDIRRHPSARVLMSYGKLPDVLCDIDGDIGLASERVGLATVTRAWILVSDLYRFHAVPFQELVWAYKAQTRRPRFPVRVSGLILCDRRRAAGRGPRARRIGGSAPGVDRRARALGVRRV